MGCLMRNCSLGIINKPKDIVLNRALYIPTLYRKLQKCRHVFELIPFDGSLFILVRFLVIINLPFEIKCIGPRPHSYSKNSAKMLARICPASLYLTTGCSRRAWEAGRANNQVDPLSHFMTRNTWASWNESWDIHLPLFAYQRERQQHWNDTISRTSTGRPIGVNLICCSICW
jgi:hypothetical protein